MRKNIFLSLFIIFLSACSSGQKIQSRSSDYLDSPLPYQSTNRERFFLGTLPIWLNFSPLTGKKRSQQTLYLNVSAIQDSYNISKKEIISLQHIVNDQENYSLSDFEKYSIKKREQTFETSLRKNSKTRRLKLWPKSKKLAVFWIDPFLEKRNLLREKKRTLKIEKENQTIIFYSDLLTQSEIEDWVDKNEMTNTQYRTLSYQMSLIQNKKGHSFFGIDFKDLKEKKQTITLYSKNKRNLSTLRNYDIIRKF